MDPKSLITDKIVDYCKPLQLIFVVGFTKSGKVTIAKELSKRLDNRPLYIADEFIERYGYDHALDEFESQLERAYYGGEQVIFEGILCFRLLRRLAEKGFILPDIVIKTECNDATISYFYSIEESNKNMNRVFGFNRGLQQIFNETSSLLISQNKKIKLLTLNTSIF